MTAIEANTRKRTGAGVNVLLGLTLLGLLALMWIVLAFCDGDLLDREQHRQSARQGSMIAILAIGETFVIITGGIDLSVGAIVGFCSMAIALMLQQDWPIWLAIAGDAGDRPRHRHLPRFRHRPARPAAFHHDAWRPCTALRGIGLLITNGATISITNDTFTGFSRGDFSGVPNLFWMVLVVAIPAYFFLHQSRWGRYLFAIGSNMEAARLSGVNVKAIIYVAYILSAVCASFVGVLLAMRIGIGNPTQAEGWELQAIASSVIGGTSLFGAIGSVHGPLSARSS